MGAIAEARFIPVIRAADRSLAAARLEAIVAGGATVIELTATVPGALDLLRTYAASVPALGLGSIRDDAVARAAIEAGAVFLVTPGVVTAVAEQARRHDALVILGGFTPTEILTAWDSGADLVKWFPASIGGIRGLRDLLGPFPDIPLIPTGGVDRDNAEAYLAAGAFAVGVGSALSEGGADVSAATTEWLMRCRR
jgi:2-dehydro-3-deoxyphosphogluconate aldolase/(4S)-4-hydroxy-2-oxoglutarate aldolase